MPGRLCGGSDGSDRDIEHRCAATTAVITATAGVDMPKSIRLWNATATMPNSAP